MTSRKVDPAILNFHHTLQKKVANGEYEPRQIFYMRQTYVFWKSTPSSVLLPVGAWSPWFTVERVQERLSMLLCTNMTGECILEPLLFLHPEHINSISNDRLMAMSGVEWRVFEKSVMSEEIFEDWFHQCLAKKIETYCQQQMIPFKALLIYEPQSINKASTGYKSIKHPAIEMLAISDSVKMMQPIHDVFVVKLRNAYNMLFDEQRNEYIMPPNELKERDFRAFIKAYMDGFKIDDAATMMTNAVKTLTPDSIETGWNIIFKNGEEYGKQTAQ